MPSPTVDAAAIVSTLNKHRVKYVVVGGFGVELWDVSLPPTVDVDVTPEQSEQNLKRLATALNDLGARIRFGDDAVSVPGGFTSEHIKEMMVLNLVTKAGALDITLVPEGTDGYADLASNARDLLFEDVQVPTADLADIARSKEAAGRPKDIVALPAIRAHLARRDR